jgi:transposase
MDMNVVRRRAAQGDLALPPVSKARLDANLRLIDALTEEVAQAERELRALFRGDDRIKRLTAIPGVGLITAATVATEVWDITRFPSADRLSSWAGPTSSEHSSGEHTDADTSPSRGVGMASLGFGRGGPRPQADPDLEPSSTASLRGVARRSLGSRSPGIC